MNRYFKLIAPIFLILVAVAQSSASGYAVNNTGGWHAVNSSADCGTGETYSDIQPPVTVSSIQFISMRQAKLQLLAMGLLTAVNTAVAGMTGDAGAAAQINWQYAATVDRNNALFQSIRTAMGFTDAQVETFFAEGNKL